MNDADACVPPSGLVRLARTTLGAVPGVIG